MHTPTIRLAAPSDAAAVLAIYTYYVLETAVSFETVPPSLREMERRMQAYMAAYPFLICEQDGQVLGYAYAHQFQARAAYAWGAELSVYLRDECRGRGLGQALYGALIALLTHQGVRTVYGCLTLSNQASCRLHERLGFTPVGVFRKAGYKHGAWHDVIWYEKAIAPYDESPAPLIAFSQLDGALTAAVLAKAGKR
jgi:L-amino acid N-acyltransferase YncA